MSRHLDEGQLLTLRDDAAQAGEDARAHLASCAACGVELAALRHRAASVTLALSALDGDWDLGAARERLRSRVAAASAARADAPSLVGRRSRWAAGSLSRAAGILLVSAAAASAALPGSPVRAWLGERLGNDAPVAAEPAVVESAPEAAVAAESTGVRLSVPSGALRVILRDVAPGTQVRVLLVAGTEAAVYAPAGSRFTSAAGRVEARVTPGEVRVELPSGVDPVSLEVGGRIFLRSTDAGLEVRGPIVTRTEDEILFRVPRS
jgi:hypothetical protein